MRFGPVRRQRAHSLRCLPGRLSHVWVRDADVVQLCLYSGELSPRERERRVERYRLLVGGHRFMECLRRLVGAHPPRRSLPPQERFVGRKAPSRFHLQLASGAIGEGHVECLGHLSRDIGLHLEHVGDRGVERSSPAALRSVARPHVDQLRRHVYPARARSPLFPLDGASEQVVHPQLTGDLLLGLLGFLVLVGAATGDDLEALDLR